MQNNINELQLLASGYTADVFTINQELVIKLYREGWSEQYVNNEYEVGKLLEMYHIKAPKVYEQVTCGNRHGILFQRLQNTTMKDQLVKDQGKWQILSKQMARQHYQINSITDEQHAFKDQKTIYRNLIKTRTSIDEDMKAKLMQTLDRKPNLHQVCHGDFHPINLLYEDKQLYTIDWLGATSGDPYADVAGSYLIMKVMGKEAMPKKNMFCNHLTEYLIDKFADAYLKEYMTLAHCSRKEINSWIAIRSATYLDVGLPQETETKLIQMIHTYA